MTSASSAPNDPGSGPSAGNEPLLIVRRTGDGFRAHPIVGFREIRHVLEQGLTVTAYDNVTGQRLIVDQVGQDVMAITLLEYERIRKLANGAIDRAKRRS